MSDPSTEETALRGHNLVVRVKTANPLPPGTFAVGAGLLVTGITSYAFLIVTARVLGPARYAPLAVLWALVFLSGPGFFLPLEQEVGRLIASRRVAGVGSGPVVRKAAIVGAGLAVGLLLVLAVVAPFVRHSLFNGQDLLIVGFALSLVGFFAAHLAKGTLSGNGRFTPYSVVLGGDSTLRLLLTLMLVAVGVKTAGPFGLILGLTPGLAALIAVRNQRGMSAPGPEAAWSTMSSALGWLLAGSVLAQLLANASVVAVKLLATHAEQAQAGQFLASLIVARVPLFLFGAVQAALLPRLSSLAGAGLFREFRSGLSRLLAVVTLLGVSATLGAFTFGPVVVDVFFGGQFQLGRVDLGYLAAASAAYMLTLAITQAIIALGHHARSVAGWLVGDAVFVVVTAAGSGLLRRVEFGFLAGSLCSTVVAFVLLWTALPGPDDHAVSTDARLLPFGELLPEA